jgi:hypothetical protein
MSIGGPSATVSPIAVMAVVAIRVSSSDMPFASVLVSRFALFAPLPTPRTERAV